jgi:signal transduction histidine kinase
VLLASLVPALILFAAAGVYAYSTAKRLLEEELGRSVAAVAAAAAAGIGGDLLLTVEPGDELEPTRTYRALHKYLSEVKAAASLRRISAFDLDGRVRVDVASAPLPVGSPFPELAKDAVELAELSAGRPTTSRVLFRATNGRFYKTGYAPIFHRGQVVAAIAVEGDAAFFSPLQRLLQVHAGLLVLISILLCVTAALTSAAIARPLLRLGASAQRIGEGDLGTPIPPQPVREVGELALALEKMRKALVDRDTQLKMMLAGVAHEVKNPLGGIQLFAGALSEQSDLSPESQSHIGRIQGEIEALKRIVDDFLAFAKERRVASAPVAMDALLRSVSAQLSPEASSKSIEIQVQAEPGTVVGDESLLGSALGNLVKNAIAASSAGMRIRLFGTQKAPHYCVAVMDEGGGIAPHIQPKVFEPFFTTREKGTGLGLALARKIAQSHGGDITFRSKPGETAFELALPFTASDSLPKVTDGQIAHR